jgi:hypothetical protein
LDLRVDGDSLSDADTQVRIEAVLGLVSLDAVPCSPVGPATARREVRVAVAVGTIGDVLAVDTLAALAVDPDPLVRAPFSASTR